MEKTSVTIYEKRALDYEQTNETIRMLTDIRFKLLAFVPTISGIALAVLKENVSKDVLLVVGLLGFFATLGIVFYDLRNTEFYDASIHRAKKIEKSLKLQPTTVEKEKTGLFFERPDKNTRLFGSILIWHDRGLALVYSPTLGAWIYLIAASVISRPDFRFIPIAFGALASVIFFLEFERLERVRKEKAKAARTND